MTQELPHTPAVADETKREETPIAETPENEAETVAEKETEV